MIATAIETKRPLLDKQQQQQQKKTIQVLIKKKKESEAIRLTFTSYQLSK